jgi:hypothetical protein
MFKYFKLAIYPIYKFLILKIKNKLWIIKTHYFFPRKNNVVISFYADYESTYRYKKAASNLSQKLTKWRIPHIFEEIQDQGGYQKNALFKPTFIQNKILKLKKNVIWIDCDTDPTSPEAIYKIVEYPKRFCAISETGSSKDMQVWLLKFEYEDFSLKLLEMWRAYCELSSTRNFNELDHEALKDGVLPHLEIEDKIGYIKLKSKAVGFKSSTTIDVGTTKIQSSLIGNEKRKQIFDEVNKSMK